MSFSNAFNYKANHNSQLFAHMIIYFQKKKLIILQQENKTISKNNSKKKLIEKNGQLNLQKNYFWKKMTKLLLNS